MSAQLCYHQHGGSGFSFTLSDVKDMGLRDIEEYCEWLEERRREEARQIKSAAAK